MYKVFDGAIDTALLDRTPFTFKQHLVKHPALALEHLAGVIPEINKDLVYFSGQKMGKGDDFERAITDGRQQLSIEEVIQNLPHSNSYIMIREPESHPAFRGLHDELVDDIAHTIRARGLGKAPLDPRSYIFISSPGSITPFHFDRASNFLFQIQGSKEVTVFPSWDKRVITQNEYELHGERIGGALTWKPESEALGVSFQCRPGDALHIPFVAGHHVKNGPEVSVTLSIFFNDSRTQAQLNALKFNHRLRKRLKHMRLAPLPVGRFRMLDHMKSLTYQSLARVRA